MSRQIKTDETNLKSDALDFLAQRMYYERTKRDWSYHKLSDLSGISSATLYHIERMMRCPTITTVEKLATALGLNIQQFFNGPTRKPPEEIVGRRKTRANKRKYKTFNEDGSPVIKLGRDDV